MNLRKTIGFRLLRYVFGCYFAIALVVTSAQLVSEYIQAKEDVFFELSHLGKTLEHSLARSLWNYNIEQAQATLLGIDKIAMISGAKVTNIDESLFARSGNEFDLGKNAAISQERGSFGKGIIHKIEFLKDDLKQTFFEYKFPVRYVDSNGDIDQLIGYCFFYADHAAIVDRVQYGFVLIIVNSLIKTAALWFIFLYFAKRIVARPMRALSDAARHLDPSNPEDIRNSDELEKIYYLGHDDELHNMAESFIRMRDAVIEKIDVIEEQNQTLEQRVKERTVRIEEVNRELKHLSLHDPLTGLPNRSLFHDRLQHLLDQAKRDNLKFAVASIDLTKFKEINDNFGHQAGDHVLKELAQRLVAAVRRVDTVARMAAGVLEILCQFFNVQHNAVRRIDNDRQIRF